MNDLTQSSTDVCSVAEVDPSENIRQGTENTPGVENEPSPITTMVEKLKAGYTRLPNHILMEMVHGSLSKAEIEILLLIARFTISFKDLETNKERLLVPLSKQTIAKYTGIQGKTVLEALQKLQDRGLVRKIQGNHETNNQFGLVYPEGLFDNPHSDGSKWKTQLPQVPEAQSVPSPSMSSKPTMFTAALTQPTSVQAEEKPPVGTKNTLEVGTKSIPPSDGKSTSPQDQKSTHYKQYEANQGLNHKYINHTKLSPQLSRESIEDYFAGIKNEARRKKESNKFINLQKTHSLGEIATGLSYLQAFGVPNTGAECHSPMGFLAVAIPSVLKAAYLVGNGDLSASQENKKWRNGQDARELGGKEISYADLVAQAREKAQQEVQQYTSERPRSVEVVSVVSSITSTSDPDFEIKYRAFQQAFPDEKQRQSYLEDFSDRHTFFKLYKNPEKFAISTWYAEHLSLKVA